MEQKKLLKRTGFTLVELLVVISIIALLVSILMPSLNRARGMAKSIVCESSLRQLGIANMMYAEDYVKIASPWNFMFGIEPILSGSGKLLGYNWQDWTPLVNPETGVIDEWYGFTTGALYPYLNSYEVFLCPSTPRSYDKVSPDYTRLQQGQPGVGQVYGFKPYWSYTCNGMPGYGDFATNGNRQPDDVALQINPDRVKPNPSTIFLYMDQNPGDGAAYDNTVTLFNPLYSEGADSLANYHNEGGNLLFYDGHVEHMKREEWINNVSTSESMTKSFVGAYSFKGNG